MDESAVGTALEVTIQVKEFIALGALIFTQLAKSISMCTGIGGIVLSLTVTFVPDQYKRSDDTELIIKELGNLKNAVSRMHEEMRQDFRSVESLIVHHSFAKDIMNKVDNQRRYLENLLGTPSNQSIEQFKHECNTRRPQTLLLDIISAIDRDVTNPIKYCLNADPLNSREIVIKWRKEIQGLAGTLAMLHGVFSGLNGWKDDGTMAANIEELGRVLDKFEQNFKLDYWSSVTTFVENTMDRKASHMEKAESITNKLEKIYTTDHLLILVYDSTGGFDNHVFYVRNESQALFRFRRGGSCVVVYASKTANTISDDAFQQYIEDWSKSPLPSGYTLAGLAKWIYEEQYGQVPLSDDVWQKYTTHHNNFWDALRAQIKEKRELKKNNNKKEKTDDSESDSEATTTDTKQQQHKPRRYEDDIERVQLVHIGTGFIKSLAFVQKLTITVLYTDDKDPRKKENKRFGLKSSLIHLEYDEPKGRISADIELTELIAPRILIGQLQKLYRMPWVSLIWNAWKYGTVVHMNVPDYFYLGYFIAWATDAANSRLGISLRSTQLQAFPISMMVHILNNLWGRKDGYMVDLTNAFTVFALHFMDWYCRIQPKNCTTDELQEAITKLIIVDEILKKRGNTTAMINWSVINREYEQSKSSFVLLRQTNESVRYYTNHLDRCIWKSPPPPQHFRYADLVHYDDDLDTKDDVLKAANSKVLPPHRTIDLSHGKLKMTPSGTWTTGGVSAASAAESPMSVAASSAASPTTTTKSPATVRK